MLTGSLNGMQIRELASKDKRDDGHQLHQYVESGTRSVLEGVSNSISKNCSLVRLRTLSDCLIALIAETTRLDILFGVIPSTTSICC